MEQAGRVTVASFHLHVLALSALLTRLTYEAAPLPFLCVFSSIMTPEAPILSTHSHSVSPSQGAPSSLSGLDRG